MQRFKESAMQFFKLIEELKTGAIKKREIIMHQINKLEEVAENIEMFMTLVEKVREKKSMRKNFISLKMEHILKTNDIEIFMNQVGGRISSIIKVKNNDLVAQKNRQKPKMKRRRAKSINEGTKHLLDIFKEAQKTRSIEVVILEHNFESSITDLFLAYYDN